MKKLFVVVSVLAAACVGAAPSGSSEASVQLLTYDRNGCYAAPAVGWLVVDPTYGTAISYDASANYPKPQPVAWRPGFTGRRVGSEIEVLGPDGRVVAVTGKHYSFVGGQETVGGISAWFACGDPTQE